MYKKHLLCALLTMLLLPAVAMAEESTDAASAMSNREEMLLERIEQLEQRLAELESRLKRQSISEEKEAVETPMCADRRPEYSQEDMAPALQNGLRLGSEDSAHTIKIGGRLHLDYAFMDHSRSLRYTFAPLHDTGEFRRARIDLKGTMYDRFDYRMEFDFAQDGKGKFTDVWMQMNAIPYLGSIKAGHFREPLGLDEQTSSNNITFMERNLATALLPGRNLGIMAHDSALDQRLGWAAGIFKEVGSFPGRQDAPNGYAYSARITGLPWYREDGRRFLHLGASYSHRLPDETSIRYYARPEIHLAARYLDTESPLGYRLQDGIVKKENLVNVEVAWVYGPFSLQGEYVHNRIATKFGGSPHFSGNYVEASYFITGEHRNYDLDSATFARITPRQNFSLKSAGGWGAWQVALRRSYLDLNSGIYQKGEAENWTFGVNWHLNPNVRLMWNYIHADIRHEAYAGTVKSLQTRLQFDF